MTGPEEISASEYNATYAPGAKRSKFGNKKTEVDGIVFDSKKEAEHYKLLKLREAADEIGDIVLQRRYTLMVNGQKICAYVADFEYWDHRTLRSVTVDVKGVRTREFIIKKKLMKAVYNIDVEEV